MGSVLRIALLLHEFDRLDRRSYFVRGLASAWREMGHDVRAVVGAKRAVDADVAILHTDLTRVPGAYLAAGRRYPVCLNLGVRDISKRLVSRQQVRRGDGWSGPVLVKTDLNASGGPEDHADRRAGALGRLRRRARRLLPWPVSGRLPGHGYRLFPSPTEVPWAVWRNPRLVVERFLPEREGDLYALRTWLFFGSVERTWLSYGRGPIVKARNVVGNQAGGPVPDDLRRVRAELGFDYGKFDYAMVEGRPVLYDVNRTPTAGAEHLGDPPSALAREMARGIDAFAASARAPDSGPS